MKRLPILLARIAKAFDDEREAEATDGDPNKLGHCDRPAHYGIDDLMEAWNYMPVLITRAMLARLDVTLGGDGTGRPASEHWDKLLAWAEAENERQSKEAT